MRRTLLMLWMVFVTGLPGVSAQTPALTPTLDDVDHWLYLLDVTLDAEVLEQLFASEHDMVVLDYIPSQTEYAGFPMAEVIAALHNAPQPKLVLAYINIGQAEDYRTYWQPNWDIGDPFWMLGDDPDEWEGNYPVAYWFDEYRQIWLDDNGYLQGILDAGFDGVFLDWVEAYADDNVIAFAEEDGVDPVQEMIWWVQDIAEFARAQRPNFYVIAQNAAELAEHDDYVDAIDAIAVEHVWFDGGANNDPPGDCPLPPTGGEDAIKTYVDTLSGGCLLLYQNDPDSSLHTSTEERLDELQVAVDQDLTIFTVDYATQPENIARVYCASRDLGFIPFVGSRALDTYVEPYTQAC